LALGNKYVYYISLEAAIFIAFFIKIAASKKL